MKAFVISIINSYPDLPGIKEMTTQAIESCKEFGYECELFDAVSPRNITEEDQKLHANINQSWRSRYLHSKKQNVDDPTNVTFCCFLSHYYMWKKSIELDEPILVLEQDGYLTGPLPEAPYDKCYVNLAGGVTGHAYVISPPAAKAAVEIVEKSGWYSNDKILDKSLPSHVYHKLSADELVAGGNGRDRQFKKTQMEADGTFDSYMMK